MKIEKLKISKLFYNKWPYKICCRIAHASRVLTSFSYGKIIKKEEDDIIKFRKAFKCFLKLDIRVRVEYDHFNIFCNDKVLLAKIHKKLKLWIENIYGPQSDEELEYLRNNGRKKRVCDKLPFDKFEYRIYFKRRIPDTLKESFLNWVSKYDGKIKCSPSTLKWMKNEYQWAQQPFCYVEDSATLTMVGLFLANHIKITEQFVLRDSINTPSE